MLCCLVTQPPPVPLCWAALSRRRGPGQKGGHIYALLLLLLKLLSGSVEADPMPRHRWQPTRPRSPWGSLGIYIFFPSSTHQTELPGPMAGPNTLWEALQAVLPHTKDSSLREGHRSMSG